MTDTHYREVPPVDALRTDAKFRYQSTRPTEKRGLSCQLIYKSPATQPQIIPQPVRYPASLATPNSELLPSRSANNPAIPDINLYFLDPAGVSRVSEKLATKQTSQRLSLISRHLDQQLPLPDLNTPFSTERNSAQPDEFVINPTVDRFHDSSSHSQSDSDSTSPTMSSQAPHPTLLIPGPIEFDDAVLQSMSHYA